MHCLPSSEIRNEREDKTMGNVTFDYKFYRIPKRFFKEDMFRDMTNVAKVLYGILLDCKCLSDSNGDAWRDEFGITYIIFTIEEIMNLMNLGNKKVNKMLIELEQHGLIYRRHQGLGKPNKIYVHDILQPETSEWTPEIQLKKRRNKK
jgi:hypothetical protein